MRSRFIPGYQVSWDLSSSATEVLDQSVVPSLVWKFGGWLSHLELCHMHEFDLGIDTQSLPINKLYARLFCVDTSASKLSITTWISPFRLSNTFWSLSLFSTESQATDVLNRKSSSWLFTGDHEFAEQWNQILFSNKNSECKKQACALIPNNIEDDVPMK